MSCLNNTIKLSIWGASHASAIGVDLEGIPQGEKIDLKMLQKFVNRRRAANTIYSTSRIEKDEVEILSGIENGVTNGKVIRARILNLCQKPQDYEKLKNIPRPSHADYVANIKFAGQEDIRGGGKFSGRMTAPMCVAGGIALQILEREGIKIAAYISEIGNIKSVSYKDKNISEELAQTAKCRNFPLIEGINEEEILKAIASAKAMGDSVGGIIECIAYNFPIGVGDAMFDGLEGRISCALFGIPAVKGVEFGSGFSLAGMNGSTANDLFYYDNGNVRTRTNHSGGINGGISNGMPVTFRVVVKPTPSIAIPQQTVDTDKKHNTIIKIEGRHDACIVPRAVPVVEAVSAIALLDAIISNKNKEGEK